MRITDWKLYTPGQDSHVFLELVTDNGISGWGAGFSEKGQVMGALAWLKRFVVGENPLEVERVTEKLHEITFWFGRGGAMTHAISAINIALWDLAGKALGQSVSVLLGGCHKRKVPAYGSVLFDPVGTLTERIEGMKEKGFRAMKFGWEPFCHQSLSEDEKLIRLVRKATGDDVTVLVDAGGSYPFWKLRLKDALQRAKMLADYGVYWFEEALAPDDIEGYVRLRELSPIKIAHGEVLARRQSFLPYLRRGAMDIAQPDVCKVGGLSELRRIAWLAEEAGIEVVPHGWNTAIGLATDLQFGASLSGRSFVEFNVGNTLIEQLAYPPFRLDKDGCLEVPSTPGLGIEIDRDVLKKFETSSDFKPIWRWDEEKLFEAARSQVTPETISS
jgi:L-alanine-DL-glutamate epimerase-like enolase superfamily enzyme